MNSLRCKIFADLHISAGKMYSLHGHRADYLALKLKLIDYHPISVIWDLLIADQRLPSLNRPQGRSQRILGGIHNMVQCLNSL